MDRVYCYPNSNVLINKLDITDAEKLHDIERKLTSLRILELIEQPIKGRFDFEQLKKIHEYIFQDIYEWAGKVRTVDIAKGNMFCKVQFIQNQADELFGKLKRENYLRDIDRDKIPKKFAYYFAEINALHPFREGNGRTQREFIRELAINAGYTVHFCDISEEEMLEASKDSFMCNYEKLEEIFSRCMRLN
jgi:cell filamentation protein